MGDSYKSSMGNVQWFSMGDIERFYERDIQLVLSSDETDIQ